MSYTSTGAKRYEGSFVLGKYHGQGILDDEASGSIEAQGEFRDNLPVVVPDAGTEMDGVSEPVDKIAQIEAQIEALTKQLEGLLGQETQ